MAPKKKVLALVKLQIKAGAATPAPPVGTALGQHVNIMAFCKDFNAKTKDQPGMVIPVVITRRAKPQGNKHKAVELLEND